MVAKKVKKSAVWFSVKKYGYGWGVPRIWQGWVALLLVLGAGFAPLIYVLNMYKGDMRCQWITHSGIASGCDPDGFKGLYIIASCMWLTAAILLLFMISTKKGEAIKWRWGKSKKEAKHASKS